MFSKSVRFHAHTNEVPGPGNYDPLDPQRRNTGVVNFAADGLQRFPTDKEEDGKLGPGYYTTPSKLERLTKHRRSSINNLTCTATDTRKKLDDMAGSWKTDRKLFEDVINELTDKLRESEKSLKTESARAQEAQSRVEATKALCEEEINKRKEVERALSTLSSQHGEQIAELRAQFKQELLQRSEMIETLKQQGQALERSKAQADQQIELLSSQVSSLEETRRVLTLEHEAIAAQVSNLEENLQQQARQCQQLDTQVRQGHQELEAQQREIGGLRLQISGLEETRRQLTVEHQTTVAQAQGLEVGLQQQAQQCADLEAQVRQGRQESEAHRSEIQGLQQRLAGSIQSQSQLTESLREKQSLCVQTQEKLEENAKYLQQQLSRFMNLQNDFEDRERQLSEKSVLCIETQNQLKESMKFSQEQRSLFLETQDKLTQTEQLRQEQVQKVASELEAEMQRARALEAELEQKTTAYENAMGNCQAIQVELQAKQHHICNLEAKINSTQLMLAASQNAFQEAQQQLNEASQLGSDLEATLAGKEEQWSKHTVECKARTDKLLNQVKKRSATILEQKAHVDKLLEVQRVFQQQKIVSDKQFTAQVEQLQQSLRTIHEQAAAEVNDYQTQLSQVQGNLQAARAELSERVASLLNNIQTAEAKINDLETEVQARNEQLAIVDDEAKKSQAQLAGQVEQLTSELSMWKAKSETLQQVAQESRQALAKVEASLTQEKTDRAEEANSHTRDVLELQTIIHENQETRQGLLAKLGSSEVQMQDLLARIKATELDAAKHAALFGEHEAKLSAEIAKSEHYVVQLANTEMEMERNKSELASSIELAADLRERLLTEQTLASEFEAKFKTEASTSSDLRQSLIQSEGLAARQKEEILSLKSAIEQQRIDFALVQHEHSLKQSSRENELETAVSNLKVQSEKNEELKHSLEMHIYKLNIASREADERREKIEMLQASAKQLELDLATQNARYDSLVAEHDQRTKALESDLGSYVTKISALMDDNASMRRAQSIDKLANERAVNAAMANMELVQQELFSTLALCEQRGAQLTKLDQSLSLAVGDVTNLQQQLKKATESKAAAVKSYTTLLKSFHALEIKLEEREAEFMTLQAESKSQAEAFDKYKDSTKSMVQENSDLLEQCDRLYKFADENRESVATIAALKVQVDELESSNRDLQESLAILDNEAKETSNQNSALVGHNNQRQKINIHAKTMTENRKLKLENIRLSNAYHDLRKASVSSSVVDENVAPTPVRTNLSEAMTTPASARAKVARKVDDIDETPVKMGPLQQSFKTWQQKKQKSLGTVEKRTPLARLNGVPAGRELATPKKVGLV